MKLEDLSDINPIIRAVKIKKSSQLVGKWIDIDHVFIYIARGNCNYHYGDNKEIYLKEGDCIIFPPYVLHELKNDFNNQMMQYIVHFDWYETEKRKHLPHKPLHSFIEIPRLSDKDLKFSEEAFILSIPEEKQHLIEKSFLNLFDEFNNQLEFFTLKMKSIWMQVLVELYRISNLSDIQTEKADEKERTPRQIVKTVIEYIYQHYPENLTNKKLASIVNISPNYLSKLFMKYTDMTLHSFLINYRIEKARELIISGVSVKEAAKRCGFSSIHVFSRSFKNAWGMSPTEYKQIGENENFDESKPKDYDLKTKIFYNV